MSKPSVVLRNAAMLSLACAIAIAGLSPDLGGSVVVYLKLGVSTVLSYSLISYLLFIRPMADKMAAEAMANARSNAALLSESKRQEFDARLHRALELADAEPDALEVVSRALAMAGPQHASELLLADSSRAHIQRVAEHPADSGPGCPVSTPSACAAVRRGQTVVFGSGEELDACPHLRGRGADVAAACVPVSILGATVGVLHATAPAGSPPAQEVVLGLEAIANQTGARIGMIRALAKSEVQASTDSLTGLLNRRSLEDRLRLSPVEEYTVVMADLDHFKPLNDTHGHDAGDRALRLFANVVRRSLRPDDLACRYGGEEFVFVLPGCNALEATAVTERLRENLALSLVNGTTPRFTASFGIADTETHGTDLAHLIASADAALMEAKREGRDRLVIAI